MGNDRIALDALIQAVAPGHLCVFVHYLYVPAENVAAAVARELSARGYRTRYRLGADGVNWLVLAEVSGPPDEELITGARQLMTDLARQNEGEYDGWEVDTS